MLSPCFVHTMRLLLVVMLLLQLQLPLVLSLTGSHGARCAKLADSRDC